MLKYFKSNTMRVFFLLLSTAILITACSTTKMKTGNLLTPRLNHLFLSVANIDSSLAFYTKAFDLTVTNRLTQLKIEQADSSFKRDVKIDFLRFAGQDFVLEISERPAATVVSSGTQLYQHLGVEVKDIIFAFKRVQDAGGKVTIPIRTVRTNNLEVKQAFFHGPDGELIELVQVLLGRY
jgi:catechol 2,3-dioxygenase-like lactoylglutathione lyase family enzyme